VTHKKDVRFVRTAEDMDRELFERGLKGTQLVLNPIENTPGTQVEGARLADLVHVMNEIESSLLILERRGVSIKAIREFGDGKHLPEVQITAKGTSKWLLKDGVDKFKADLAKELGRDLIVDEDYTEHEYHEARSINRGLDKLAEFGFNLSHLLPQERIAGREPPLRFEMVHGESRKVLNHLRDLPAEIRKQGEKGWIVTRFKGLGEMDPNELWDTTLNPEVRTPLQVRLEDAMEADDMFRVLMGEKVEPRRDFIFKHALEVNDIDFHGA
jgi:DNA gyrase subunit B